MKVRTRYKESSLTHKPRKRNYLLFFSCILGVFLTYFILKILRFNISFQEFITYIFCFIGAFLATKIYYFFFGIKRENFTEVLKKQISNKNYLNHHNYYQNKNLTHKYKRYIAGEEIQGGFFIIVFFFILLGNLMGASKTYFILFCSCILLMLVGVIFRYFKNNDIKIYSGKWDSKMFSQKENNIFFK